MNKTSCRPNTQHSGMYQPEAVGKSPCLHPGVLEDNLVALRKIKALRKQDISPCFACFPHLAGASQEGG